MMATARHAPEDHLAAALWHATAAAHSAMMKADRRGLSPAATAALAAAEAEEAGTPSLAILISKPALLAAYARGAATEAVRLAREGGEPPPVDTTAGAWPVAKR